MKPTSFSYAQSLRAIGESLEAQGINGFELEKQDENCILRVIAAQPASERSFFKRIVQILRRSQNCDQEPSDPAAPTQSLCYTPSDISRLMTEQQSQHGAVNVMADAHKLAQVLRVVGDYLDRKEASAFTVSMSGDSLSVAYETGSGHQINESFTTENLYDRAVNMYLRRSKRHESVA
jgi:hypothetical protein